MQPLPPTTTVCPTSAKSLVKVNRKRRLRTAAIGTGSFSIPADHTATVKIALDLVGRKLLRFDRGHLEADLTITQLAPAPKRSHVDGVQLVQRQAHEH